MHAGVRTLLRRTLLVLSLLLCTTTSLLAVTFGGSGGQCVTYVRAQMSTLGFRADTQMPGLCQFWPYDCSASLIYTYWEFGYGRGQQPASRSLMVIGRDPPGVPIGHVAIIEQVIENSNGTKTLIGRDSNANGDELIYTDVRWQFNPSTMQASREGQRWHPVLGFVYTRNPDMVSTPAPVLSESQKAETILNCGEVFASMYFSSPRSTMQWPQQAGGIAYVRSYGPFYQPVHQAVWNGDYWYFINGWHRYGPVEQLRPWCAMNW